LIVVVTGQRARLGRREGRADDIEVTHCSSLAEIVLERVAHPVDDLRPGQVVPLMGD